jgi:hypothetical protein
VPLFASVTICYPCALKNVNPFRIEEGLAL